MRVCRLWLRLRSPRVSAGLPARCSPGLRRKSSRYGDVDSEYYAALLKAVTCPSSRTPPSIEREEQRLYGSVVRPQARVSRTPRSPWPLLNDAKRVLDGERVEGSSVTRIILQRESAHAAIPSVTRILQKTMSARQAFYLERWKKRKIAELGEEGFKEYSTNLFTQGKVFHGAVEGILSGEQTLNESESVAGYLQSISHVMEDVTGVKAIESVVQHQPLHYLGIVDCVAMYKNSLCLIEWKTSERPKPFLYNTYDNPLQVAAYIGALNSDKNYNYQVDSGLIVVAYKDGSPAHYHFLKADQVVQYWNEWLFRLEEYMAKNE